MEEFLAVQKSNGSPGVSGWWEQVIPELDAEQHRSLMEAAASNRISHRTIAVVLGKWGHEVSPQQVGHWRRTHVR